MELKDGYKQTELGIIPEDWEVKKLGEVLYYEQPTKYIINSEILKEGRTPVLTANKSFILGYTNEDFNIYTNTPVVIFDDFTTLNKYVDFRFKIKSSAIKLLKNNPNYSLEFIYNKMQLIDYALGDHKRYYISEYQNIEIKVPSLREQQAIVEVLSDTDELIQTLKKLIAKKKTVKQGAMQELLTGKKRLQGFNGKWETKKLGEVAFIKTGSKNNKDKVDDGDYPFFVRSQSVERINTYSYDCEAILIPGEGGIGSIFHYINGKFDVHQRVYVINDFSKNVSGKYIYLFMKKNFGNHAIKNSVKATVDSLRLPTFQEFKIELPKDIKEQQAIAEILSDMDAEIAALEQQVKKTQILKQGIMQELLTGRIRLVKPATPE